MILAQIALHSVQLTLFITSFHWLSVLWIAWMILGAHRGMDLTQLFAISFFFAHNE